MLSAGVASEAVEETAAIVARQFSKEVTKELGAEGAALLTERLSMLAARYGETEALAAARKVGPRVFRVVEEAGEEAAPQALRLMGRMGEDSLWIVARRQSMNLVTRYGDDAAAAILKHKEIAETLIEQLGPVGARALKEIDGQGARRLAMLAEDGTLAAVPEKQKLLETVAKHGDAAMNWIWRNKGALTTAAVITAFVADPKPFIDGTAKIAEVGAEHVAGPVAAHLSTGIANRTNWTLVFGLLVVGVTGIVLMRTRRKHAGPAVPDA
jgi:LPXTG-motif cell wall-anchored protein